MILALAHFQTIFRLELKEIIQGKTGYFEGDVFLCLQIPPSLLLIFFFFKFSLKVFDRKIGCFRNLLLMLQVQSVSYAFRFYVCMVFHLDNQSPLFSVVPYEVCPTFCLVLLHGLDFLLCVHIVKDLMEKPERFNCLKRINMRLIRRLFSTSCLL